MKVFSCALAFLFVANVAAQNIDTAKSYLQAGKLAAAKTQIDAVMAKASNAKYADAYFMKSRIYIALAADPVQSNLYPGSRVEAWKSFQQYAKLDTNVLLLKLYGYSPVNDLYGGFYTEGANAYNSSNWVTALHGFGHAVKVSSLMIAKGWTQIKLDTNTILYAAVAAERLQQWADVATFYGLLADGRVAREGFGGAYSWLTNYHYEMKDKVAAKHYLSIGKELYPADTSWVRLERDIAKLVENKPVVVDKLVLPGKTDTGPLAPVQPVTVIIQKHITAIGGNTVIASIRSMETDATIDAMGSTLTSKTSLLTGKGYKAVSNFNGQEVIQVVTPTGGWYVNPLAGILEATALEATDVSASQSLLTPGGNLFRYAEKGALVIFVSSEKLDGVNVYKLRYTKKDGAILYLYLDAATYYLLRAESSSSINGVVSKSVIDYSDYRKTPIGYVMAFVTRADQGIELTTTIDAVRFNVPIAATIFTLPGK